MSNINNIDKLLELIKQVQNIKNNNKIAPGLENLGFTCFHNSATQLFYRITELKNFLINDKIKNQYTDNNIFRNYLEIITEMNNTNENYLKKNQIEHLVQISCSILENGYKRQQDAYEFLNGLLNLMIINCTDIDKNKLNIDYAKLCNQTRPIRKFPDLDPRNFLTIKKQELRCDLNIIIDKNTQILNNKIIVPNKEKNKNILNDDKFNDYINNNIEQITQRTFNCNNNYQEVIIEESQILSLDIDEKSNKSIEYFINNLLTNINFRPIEDRKNNFDVIYRINAQKENYIFNKYLLIQLKIFIYDQYGNTRKKSHNIQLAYNSGYITINNNKYELVGTVNHSGSLNSGHYWANIKYGNTWYEYNDDKITVIPDIKSTYSSAYLVLYRQFNNNEPFKIIQIENLDDNKLKLENYLEKI